MTETEKEASFNIAGLSVASSAFSDLDKTSSWVRTPPFFHLHAYIDPSKSYVSYGITSCIVLTCMYPSTLLILLHSGPASNISDSVNSGPLEGICHDCTWPGGPLEDYSLASNSSAYNSYY